MRHIFERGARVLALALMAWLAWSAAHPVARAGAVHARASDVPARAREWAQDAGLASLHLDIDSTPEPDDLAFLAALEHAGTTVGWSGPVPPLGVSVAPLADPAGVSRLAIASAPHELLSVSDHLGPLDSVRARGVGAELFVNELASPARVRSGAFSGAASNVDSLLLRPVLVIGSAGWEAKFVVAALEERGWHVATQLVVGPATRVTQGNAAPIDTGRYSAVVVLDTSAAPWAAAIARYVRSGGGLVLAGRGGAASALVSLAPATLGAHRAGRPALVADSVGLRSLGRWTFASLRPGAASVSRVGGEVTVAARVVGAGRVVQTGTEESWRWRMEGAPGSDQAHREWWSRLVSSVAYAPAMLRETAIRTVAAPRAQIIDALGPSAAEAKISSSLDPLRSAFLFATLLALLLAEWGSRRLRGAR
jgi:hypothetical protein